MKPINVLEYRERAREALDASAWDYYASGARDEITLAENREAFRRIRLRYRVLRDVSRCDPSLRLGGGELSMPVMVAPTAFHGLADPEGEVATARAASDAGTVMILSTLSNRRMEEVAEAGEGEVWFQLYVHRDREATRGLVRRAEEAGCAALVLTVDAPVLGTRERDVRNEFRLPEHLDLANLPPGLRRMPEAERESSLAAHVASRFDASIGWKDVERLRRDTDLPLWVKGLVHPGDARLAVEHGVDGIVVSNHGGRQLDGAPASVDALPAVAAAVDGRVPVVMDGGVRRGADVVKALARGADAVAVGRPILWGLAADGREGARHVLRLLREELEEAMALCGCPTPAEIGPDLLFGGGPAA